MHLSEKLFLVAFFHYLGATLLNVILAAYPAKRLRRAAVGISFGGATCHTMGLVARYIEAGRVELAAYEKAAGAVITGWERTRILLSHPPFTNLFESLVFFAWGVVVIYLYIELKKKPALVGLFANSLAVLAVGLASLMMDREISPLVPALQSWWLHIHVALAATGYGAFLVAAIFSFLFLLKDGVDVRKVGMVLALVSVLMLAGLARGTPLFSGGYGMGLVAKHGHKPAVAFVEFETGGKGGVRAVETELKKTAGAAGIFISLAALSFLSAAAAYSARRRMPAVAKAGDAAFALGFALLSGALATFIRNATSEAPAAATEADVKALVDATAEGLGLAGAASRVNVQAPLYFSMRAGPYDFALLAFLWLACAFQLLLVFKSQDLVKGLPDSASLDETAYRITLLAFPMLTLIIVTGAVWAHFAWGRYWGWDPKETWSLITWFVYAFYMHARITHGWTGRPSAVISVAGFAVVVFTYLGVNLGLTGSGLHVYGKG